MNSYDFVYSRAQSKKKEFRLLAEKIKKLNTSFIDSLFHQLHDKAFQDINCLDCARCCSGLGPRLIKTDIDRIAGFLKLKVSAFTDKYLRVDEDHDYVFSKMPCPFLMKDNYCSIYEIRPKACREYPHTDRKNIKGIIDLCLTNTKTCPAVLHIFENLTGKLNNK